MRITTISVAVGPMGSAACGGGGFSGLEELDRGGVCERGRGKEQGKETNGGNDMYIHFRCYGVLQFRSVFHCLCGCFLFNHTRIQSI